MTSGPVTVKDQNGETVVVSKKIGVLSVVSIAPALAATPVKTISKSVAFGAPP